MSNDRSVQRKAGSVMFTDQVRRLQSRLGIRHTSPALALLYVHKNAYQRFYMPRPSTQRILAIFGCQRSGTSLLTRVFFRDLHAKIYRETSRLSSKDKESPGRKLRINEFDSISATIARDNAPLIVLKPLVESQRATAFLDFFPQAKGMWLYRHYRDVAASNLHAFGINNGIDDLRPIANGESNNWRSEYLPADVQALIQQHFSETMNPYDAAALFWYVRNRLFFDLALERDPRIMLCHYDEWVTNPGPRTRQMYQFVGLPYPGDHIIKEVHAESVRKGQNIPLSPEIEELCSDLMDRIDHCYTHAPQ